MVGGGWWPSRTAELDALIADCARATRGEGTAALGGGGAGGGKSRLVAELAAHARHQGARVLVGQCLDLEEGGLPYAPVVDILRTLERELTAEEGAATLGPLRAMLGRAGAATAPDDPAPAGDAPPAGQVGQARLFELLLTVIERLVDARPLVMVLEDLHWADRSTLDLVSLVASSTRSLPVLTVGTYRSEDAPPRHPLRTLTAELTRRGAHHLRLRRLGAGEVAELLGALLPAPPAPEVTASVVERSDGNPLFVEELAAVLADDPTAAMPPGVRDAVISRVGRMDDEAATVLRACAAGGREVEHDLLAEVLVTDPADADPDGAAADRRPTDPARTGLAGVAPGAGRLTAGVDPRALDLALRAAVDQGLLVADQQRGSYRFRHALVHEAVLGDVLPGELHRLHRSYATALERRRAGRDAGDQGWARLTYHWDAAAEYDAALAAADRADLLARAADAASRCGAMMRALTLVDEALATAEVGSDPVRAGTLHERRGWD